MCGAFCGGNKNLCDKHSLTMFQVVTSLEEFIKNNPPPKWLTDGLQEMGWIYQQYPRTFGYFNTAEEVVQTFVVEQVPKIHVDEIKEINYTALPNERVLNMLERAWIAERDGRYIRPGKLTRRLQETRLGGYDLNTPEIKEKIKEFRGILTLALTKSLLENLEEEGFMPRQIIAVLDLLSTQMLASGEEIDRNVPSIRVDSALYYISPRQRYRTVRIMSGFRDGETKILTDVDERGDMIIKESMVPYLTEMRERWRTRERELERGA